MAIAYKSSGIHLENSTNNTYTFSSVALDVGDVVVLFAADDNTASTDTVTVNGNAATGINTTADSYFKLWSFYYVVTSAGAQNIVFDRGGGHSGSENWVTGYSVYKGCDTNLQPDSSTTAATPSGTSITETTTVVNNGSWFVGFTEYGLGGLAASTGCVSRQIESGFCGIFDSNAALAPGSQSMTQTGTTGLAIALGITLKPADLSDNLISYYRLSKSTIDSVSAKDGTATSLSYNTGKILSGGDFNGSTSKVILPVITGIGAAAFSFAGWIKTTNTGSQKAWFAGAGNTTRNFIEAYITSGNKAGVEIADDGGGAASLTGTTNINDGNWHYIVVTMENDTNMKSKLYVDGVLEDSNTAGSPYNISQMNNGYAIGCGVGYTGTPNYRFWSGSIDEVGVWNKCLDSAEITALYNSGTGLAYPFFNGIAPQNTATNTAGSGNATVTISSFQIEGNDGCLVVSVCNQGTSGSTSGVTANGVAMTLIDTQAVAGANGVTLWGLYGATTGNIVATRTGSTSDRITICAVNYTGVNSTTAIASLVKAKGTSSGNIAAALTTTVDNDWVSMGTYVSAGGDVSSAGANTIKRVIEPEIGDHWDTGVAVSPAGSRTLNVTNTGTPSYAWVAVALEPGTATPPAVANGGFLFNFM